MLILLLIFCFILFCFFSNSGRALFRAFLELPPLRSPLFRKEGQLLQCVSPLTARRAVEPAIARCKSSSKLGFCSLNRSFHLSVFTFPFSPFRFHCPAPTVACPPCILSCWAKSKHLSLRAQGGHGMPCPYGGAGVNSNSLRNCVARPSSLRGTVFLRAGKTLPLFKEECCE